MGKKKKLIIISVVCAVAAIAAAVGIAFFVTRGNEPHVCSFDTWTVSREANCTYGGEETSVCSCGAVSTRQTEAVPGKHVHVTTVLGVTCVKEGFSLHECEFCGDT